MEYSDDLGKDRRVIETDSYSYFTVSKQEFNKMIIKNKKNGLTDVFKLMINNFKNLDKEKDLADLDLFNLATHPRLSSPRGRSWTYVKNILSWDKDTTEKWTAMFTFGESLDTGLYYSFASNIDSESVDFII